MDTESFDINSLLRLRAPKYFCRNCYALFLEIPWSETKAQYKCPVCDVEYIPTKDFPIWGFGDYQKEWGYSIHFDDLIGHAKELAAIPGSVEYLRNAPTGELIKSPMISVLLQALRAARQFVHFTTYGMSHMLLGAVKMVAQQVPVRGIVSEVDESLKEELTQYPYEADLLDVKLFERKGNVRSWDKTPHQEIIIIDGMLAFKGSANLTISGWRKASQGRDMIEVVTNAKEVIDLNNRYFSPIWAEFSRVRQIKMERL